MVRAIIGIAGWAMTVTSPLNYFGGKHRLAKDFISLIPPHRCYVEVFGGGGSVLCQKSPSLNEVYNDINSEVVNLFDVLRCPTMSAELIELCVNTPYSRELFMRIRDESRDTMPPVYKAWHFFTVSRLSFGGSDQDRTAAFTASPQRAHAKVYDNTVKRLHQVRDRLRSVVIENLDYREILDRYDNAASVFYCDPPYLPETRKGGGYTHEMTYTDHEELLERLLKLDGRVMLSGYPNSLYDDVLKGWTIRDFSHKSSANTSGNRDRVERVWLNYEEPKQLEMF